MRLKHKRLAFSILIIYLLLSSYVVYTLFNNISTSDEGGTQGVSRSKAWFGLGRPGVSRQNDWHFSLDDSSHQEPPDAEPEIKYTVEIWGKAAITMYLWEHIFDANIIEKMGGVWYYGTKQVQDIQFILRTGPGVVPAKVPVDVQHLVLILNGREQSKIDLAKIWLDYLPNLKALHNVAVLLLGNERCDNDWIKPYLTVNGGLVRLVFIVYDNADIDDYTFYQWPLGVATYRNFPCVDSLSINSEKKRYFQCNFLGTIYANSSREVLLKELKDPGIEEHCYVKPRQEWWPAETEESQADYIHALLQSDYTLCPVGMNPECYRIYEAMAYGSIPILEDTSPTGRCRSPYKLLKQYRAPVVFIKDWTELKSVLHHEMSPEELVRRRRNVLEWYIYFRRKMKEKFVKIIKSRFFNL